MKIQEILVESQDLEEGPLLNKIGSAIGKGVGTLAKGVGAVAGGVAGAGTALKKGFQAGRDTVAMAGDDEADAPAAPAAKPAVAGATAAPGAAPAAGDDVGGPTAQPAAGDVNKAGPAGTAPAKPLQGQAKVAADKTAAATAGQDQSAAGQTMYAQVKANIDKLDKKGKQRILQLLQKSIAVPAAPAAPAGGGAMGAMAGQLGAAKPAAAPANTMANAPVSATNTAKPGNPNAAAPPANPSMGALRKPAAGAAPATTTSGKPLRTPMALQKPAAGAAAPAAEPDGRVEPTMEPAAAAPAAAPAKAKPVAKVGTTPAADGANFNTQTGKMLPGRAINAVKKKAEVGAGALGKARKGMQARADQATIDAERDKIMGTTTDSVIRTQPSLAEGFSLYRKRA